MKEGTLIDGVQTRAKPSASTQLGERVRQLRAAAGLTQTELAGDRFSKEYISQIELGKTRPTQETIEWLASRLKADPGYLEHGVETQDLARAEALLAQGEALAASGQHEDAVKTFASATAAVAATGMSDLEFRRVTDEAWSRTELGEIKVGVNMLVAAAELPCFASLSEIEQAEYFFRLGVGRFKLGSTHIAMTVLSEAHTLAERSMASDALRVQILRWRSICLQRLRDYDLAREDAERSVELAEHLGQPRTLGDALFQASLIAAREGRYALSRRHAERAREKYAEADVPAQLGKVINNLGGVQFELRNYDEALVHFKDSYRTLLDAGETKLCAIAQHSIAQVQLEQGNAAEAVEQAAAALVLFDDDPEWLEEEAEAQYTIGRALIVLDRLDDAEDALKVAADTFVRAEVRAGLSKTYLAQGDVAARRNDDKKAAELYRRSAEMLQDTRF